MKPPPRILPWSPAILFQAKKRKTFEKSFKPHQKSCATLAPISCSGSSLAKGRAHGSSGNRVFNPLEKGGENLENSRCCYSQVIISINWKPPKPATVA